ncbi:MAG: protease inhibitor I42 family protein [Chloroflexi bacterium]|nr:protease inhibitor I42 family protein [Chloroflexota bacterium]
MKKILWLALFLLSACDAPPIPTLAQYTASDNGKTIGIARDQTFTIVLASNASTGFVWNLVLEPDAAVLDFVSQEYATQSSAPGAGGTETWEFKAVGVGVTQLKLQYFRPFDAKNIAGEFILNVEVK